MPEAITFYETAGFEPHAYDDGYAFVRYADASVFDLVINANVDPANNGAGCFMVTDDAEGWYARHRRPAYRSPRSPTCRGECVNSPSRTPVGTMFGSGAGSDVQSEVDAWYPIDASNSSH